MADAREEAERRWPMPNGYGEYSLSNHDQRAGFVAGAEWQAAQQSEPTDTDRDRINDLRSARDAVSSALAHRLHETDPDMFFLAIRQLLISIMFLVDGYVPGAEEDNR